MPNADGKANSKTTGMEVFAESDTCLNPLGAGRHADKDAAGVMEVLQELREVLVDCFLVANNPQTHCKDTSVRQIHAKVHLAAQVAWGRRQGPRICCERQSLC